MDYTYFKEWICPMLYDDSQIQGYIMTQFKDIKKKIKEVAPSNTVKIPHNENNYVFKLLLKYHHKIHKIIGHANGMYIITKESQKK